MTFDEYRDATHEMVNSISDICNTTIVTDQMTLEDVTNLLYDTLRKINELAFYPDLEVQE